MKSVSICMDLLTKPSWSFWWQNLPFLLKNCCFWDPTQIFQPDEIQFQMCGCTYEIQPDEFSPRGWKSYFQPIEKIHQNFTSKIFIWLKKFNQMKFIWLTQRKYQLSFSEETFFHRYLKTLNEKPVNVWLFESVCVGTPWEGVCENVLESKADTLFSPTRERTLVLVNPFSKVQTLLVVVTEIS